MDEEQMKKAMYEARRYLPQSDIEFNAMTTQPVWGQQVSEVPVELRDKLKEVVLRVDKQGLQSFEENSLWELLSYFTRDLRLGNLQSASWKNGFLYDEVAACRYYLDLAGDLLHFGYKRAFLICLSRVASIIEVSQSRGGFFRRRLGTITGENIQGSLDPPKRTFFGTAQKSDNYKG